jgi:hypothetical protein
VSVCAVFGILLHESQQRDDTDAVARIPAEHRPDRRRRG